MPIPADIDAILQAIAATPLATAKLAATKGKIHELWLVVNIADALRKNGWFVQMRTSNDRRAAQFIQRGAPGWIQPIAFGANNPSFFYLRRPDGREFELHNSLVFRGRSGASHEFDICVFSRSLGKSLRKRAEAQRAYGHPMYSVECKQYTAAVGIDVPRGVMACTFDGTRWTRAALSHRRKVEGNAVMRHTTLSGRLGTTFTAIVTPNGISKGAKTLANRYSIRLFDSVEVVSGALDIFLRASVRWLNRYQG
ncbi:hypothetical protein [Reyranella sp.]|uniref:hypothetical protein n=1 Tax=Reyranella sp. TaxID=1929291 RepID=UPI003D14FE70